MAATGPNLPIVIQQAGDVSRVQEQVQRAGEMQQSAAGSEAAKEQEAERTQVRKFNRPDTGNQVKAEDESKKQRNRARSGARRKKKKGRAAEEARPPAKPGSGVVDVII